jgi:hypothetical protein
MGKNGLRLIIYLGRKRSNQNSKYGEHKIGDNDDCFFYLGQFWDISCFVSMVEIQLI